jgi:hypothetical protein
MSEEQVYCICQHAKEKEGLLYHSVNKVSDDADAEHLFEQQLNFSLVLVKLMLLLDPALFPLLIKTSERAQTPDNTVQCTVVRGDFGKGRADGHHIGRVELGVPADRSGRNGMELACVRWRGEQHEGGVCFAIESVEL